MDKLESIRELPFTPPLPLLSTVESIAPPSVQAALNNEHLAKKCNQRQMEAVERNFSQMASLEKEMLHKIQEFSQKEQSSHSWQLLRDISAFPLAALNLALGAYATSTILGVAMVTSSVLTIANFIFEHTPVWDSLAKKMAGENEELQKKIRTLFPAAISIASSMLAIGGTAAMANSPELLQKLFSIVQGASYLIQGALAIQTGIQEGYAKLIEISIDDLKTAMQQVKYSTENGFKRLEEFYEFMTKSIEEASLLIKATLNTIQVTQQPV